LDNYGISLINDYQERFPIISQADTIKKFATQIINGAKIENENVVSVFQIMNRLTTQNPDDRQLYFKAFGKICEQADGFVAEAIGSSTLEYFKFNPAEFIENSRFIQDSSFILMANSAGMQFFVGDSIKDEIHLKTCQDSANRQLDKFILQIYGRCKTLDSKNKIKLDYFIKLMKIGLKSTYQYFFENYFPHNEKTLANKENFIRHVVPSVKLERLL
jgi:hypothetical protein